MWVRSLGGEDALEEGMATHSSFLAKTGESQGQEPGRLQFMACKESDMTEATQHAHTQGLKELKKHGWVGTPLNL